MVFADVGLTHQLKQKRAELLSDIDQVKNDSVVNHHLVDSLHEAVISLDARIIKSYDETVDRMAAEKRQRGASAQAVVLIAIVTTATALLMTVLLIMARRRIIRSSGSGLLEVYRKLTTDLVNSVSSEKTNTHQLIRVNAVVLAGLIFMSVSVIAFLLRTL